MGRSRLRIGLTQKGSDEGGSTGRTSKQIEDYHRRKRTFQYKKNDRGKIIKIPMLTGGQAKLDKNKNNKIDAEDFKLLRGGKKRGGLFHGYSKVFDTAAKAGQKNTGTSTIVGVKPNPKKPKKTFKSMAEMRKAKGFKTGETAAQFNKRKAAGEFAKRAAKATGARGKIALGVAAAGVGAIQYLKSKMKKKKEEPKKKMGGGMMQRPMGYKAGGPLGSAGKGLGRAAGRKAEQKRVGQTGRRAGLSSLQRRSKKKNLEDRAFEAGTDNIFSNFRSSIKKAEKQYANIPSGMKKDRDTDAEIKVNLIRSNRKDPFKEFDDSRREVYATERMGGGMMNKPMGYKSGKSIKVKCKLGKNKPTKMY